MEYVKLNNGVEMPILGYGVYQVTPEECERCVSDAIKIGYRSIDTAQAYHNEEGVGRAVRKSGIPREEFFITTKVWITNGGYEKAKASIDESLRKLQTSYVVGNHILDRINAGIFLSKVVMQSFNRWKKRYRTG